MNSEFERLILIYCVDTPDLNSIEVINTFCCLNGISLILAWDNEELGRYVETISVLLEETGIGECINLDFLTITNSTLAEISYLNKVDVSTFINIFRLIDCIEHVRSWFLRTSPGLVCRKHGVLHL